MEAGIDAITPRMPSVSALTEESPFDVLPREMLFLILELLTTTELSRLAQTSSTMYSRVQGEVVRRGICLNETFPKQYYQKLFFQGPIKLPFPKAIPRFEEAREEFHIPPNRLFTTDYPEDLTIKSGITDEIIDNRGQYLVDAFRHLQASKAVVKECEDAVKECQEAKKLFQKMILLALCMASGIGALFVWGAAVAMIKEKLVAQHMTDAVALCVALLCLPIIMALSPLLLLGLVAGPIGFFIYRARLPKREKEYLEEETAYSSSQLGCDLEVGIAALAAERYFSSERAERTEAVRDRVILRHTTTIVTLLHSLKVGRLDTPRSREDLCAILHENTPLFRVYERLIARQNG